MWPIKTVQFKKLGLESFVTKVHKIELWFSEFGVSEIFYPVDIDWHALDSVSNYGQTIKNYIWFFLPM